MNLRCPTSMYLMITLLMTAALSSAAAAEPLVGEKDGLIVTRPVDVPDDVRNTPWPAELEKGFWKRANHAIDAYRQPARTATTGEHEKWNHPALMFNYVAGLKDHAVSGLQAADQNAGDHKGTLGIDWYWCFTIKNQIRKFFYFGEVLDDAYVQRMREAGRRWTADDPRYSLELVLSLDSPDPAVRQAALQRLNKMRVSTERMRELGEEALASDQEIRRVFGRHMLQLADEMTDEPFGEDREKWRAWYRAIAAGDWQVFEEYERQVNPRPHPVYGIGTGPVGGAWDPKVRGNWVDARNTDNLRAMRETSVYLMAEETGNEEVRRLYKDKIRRFVTDLYRVGMGEWDSETYHGHTMAPYLNLYDFAKDKEVKLMAKAALDWLSTAAALKYYRGGYGGPVKRDYGGARKVFGSDITHLMYLYFGDSPLDDPKPHYDDIHAITSAYRPPLAVVGIARKQFDKPVRMHNVKATYSLWVPGATDKPEFYETLQFGDSYYLGTLTSAGTAGDVSAFKLLAWNPDRGVDYVLANSGGKRIHGKNAGDQIGQYGNLAVWLRPSDKPMLFQVPGDSKVRQEDGWWVIDLARTQVQIRPLNLQAGVKIPHNPDKEYVEFRAKPTGGGYAGFALQVLDKPIRGAGRATVRTDQLDQGEVTLTGADGKTLTVRHNPKNHLPIVHHDGREMDWSSRRNVYGSPDGPGPVELDWKGDGKLTVRAGGYVFTQTVTPEGKVTFSEVKQK